MCHTYIVEYKDKFRKISNLSNANESGNKKKKQNE